MTSKQRQRQLARAKWERQQARRAKMSRRQRVISVVVGTVVGLVVVGGLAWLVVHIVNQEQSRQTPAVPTDSFSTNLLTPTTPPQTAPSQQPTNTAKSPKHSPSTKGGSTTGAPRTKATKSGGNG